ncbi:MAG TPA: hypothetical protein VG893_06305 [Terracidiphilus sp.]|nr:hypothetical protein [Terracidiphilus sp.]
MIDERRRDILRFYSILDNLETMIGGARKLADCDGRMGWPRRGVYFFREPGEIRSDTGVGPRVVRVGTHALTETGDTSLWSRLCTHKGQTKSGGGNHRGSIFRLIVGTALIRRDSHTFSTWGKGNSAAGEVRASEIELECAVSQVIRDMPFLWLAVMDEPGPRSVRGRIERNSIALLSNFNKTPLDPPSANWLGLHCDRDRVRLSGLWNQNHVDEDYDPGFLDQMEQYLDAMAER